MNLIQIVITLLVVGVLLYVVEILPYISATIKRIIHIVVIVAVLIWLLKVFGVWSYLNISV